MSTIGNSGETSDSVEGSKRDQQYTSKGGQLVRMFSKLQLYPHFGLAVSMGGLYSTDQLGWRLLKDHLQQEDLRTTQSFISWLHQQQMKCYTAVRRMRTY